MDEATYIAENPAFNGTAKLVVISGCSGGGKSSLIHELGRQGYPVFPEPGRQIVKEQLSIGGDGLPWENTLKFAELCVSRALFFYNMARPGALPAIFDRSFIDNIAAIDRLGLPQPHAFTQALRRYRYSRRVFLVPPWKELFVGDAERRHSFEAAEAEYEALRETYTANEYEIVLIPKAPLAERVAFLERQFRP